MPRISEVVDTVKRNAGVVAVLGATAIAGGALLSLGKDRALHSSSKPAPALRAPAPLSSTENSTFEGGTLTVPQPEVSGEGPRGPGNTVGQVESVPTNPSNVAPLPPSEAQPGSNINQSPNGPTSPNTAP